VGDYYDDTPWLPLVLMKAERMNICDTVVYDYLERSDSLVNAKSPKAVQRKIDGGLLLLEILAEQLRTITDKGVRGWYDVIIAHATISLLTLVGVRQFAKRNEYLSRLQQLNLYPLSTYRAEKKARRKIQLINTSSRLFLWMVHLKNKR
jgi:hypothetical protein